MAFKFGKKSKEHMKGVHPKLMFLAEETLKLSPVDITVTRTGGLRTASTQMALYRAGASKIDGRSRKSKHQKQSDGFGHALDLVPWVAGSPRWEWPLIYPIAGIMAMLSKKHDIDIRWGGVWDKELDDFIGKERDPEKLAQIMKSEVHAYTIRHEGSDFIDGPHYELH
jgi:peptidoglycan L-alanyl-D-glutamate endopeptidase CwlK